MLKMKAIEQMVKPFVVDNTGKDIPWQLFQKPLNECSVALVTTAGVHLKDQTPFDVAAKEGDASFREISNQTAVEDYRITHTHYDHSEADKDINCVFPITRLNDLAKDGLIKKVSEVHYGFMGYILNSLHESLKANARKIAQKLLEHQVDVVLLTPG